MQMYVLVRAQHDKLERWKSDCQAQYFPYKINGNTVMHAQLQVRPIELVELAFPETAYEDVLGRIQPYNYSPELDRKAFLLRKMLGLESVKKFVPRNGIFNDKYIHVIPIGTRKDRYDPNGAELI